MSPPPASLAVEQVDGGLTAQVAFVYPAWVMQLFLTVGFLGSALLMVVWNDPVARAALMVSVLGAGIGLMRSEGHDSRGTNVVRLDAEGITVAGTVAAHLPWDTLTRCSMAAGPHNHDLVLHHHDGEVTVPVDPLVAADVAWLATAINVRIHALPSAMQTGAGAVPSEPSPTTTTN